MEYTLAKPFDIPGGNRSSSGMRTSISTEVDSGNITGSTGRNTPFSNTAWTIVVIELFLVGAGNVRSRFISRHARP
jgi:hypothetical protein